MALPMDPNFFLGARYHFYNLRDSGLLLMSMIRSGDICGQESIKADSTPNRTIGMKKQVSLVED